jgi:hypothetical protein
MYVKKPFFGDLAFIYEIEDRVQAGQRPDIPTDCPTDYANLIKYIFPLLYVFPKFVFPLLRSSKKKKKINAVLGIFGHRIRRVGQLLGR